jgi:ADP-ribose pyrophosphatase YjhB (NUDIX family)
MTDDRRYPARPILGVGAIILDEDRVLLVQRGREPLKGQWSLPGGAVETGESVAAALQREVLEETALHVEIGPLVEIFERIMPDATGRAEYHYVLLDYLCRVSSGSPQAGSDVAATAWVKRAALGGIQLTSGTLPVIEKAFHGSLVG